MKSMWTKIPSDLRMMVKPNKRTLGHSWISSHHTVFTQRGFKQKIALAIKTSWGVVLLMIPKQRNSIQQTELK